ncbi:fungal-specific transcription factor domain-containing protein [Pilaira anomala]|nr:fungal-specific transcription factor domain-containing protein [Pilaira anomala]
MIINNISREKVVRYHGSSSGYYIVGDILTTDEKNVTEVPAVISGDEPYRIRRMNETDDDLMVVRDTTADEEASQIAIDQQEDNDCNIPKSVLIALVHTYFANDHTTLPVLDREEYMDAFQGRTTPPPAPLLTYAICTYSCFLLKCDDPIFRDVGVERDAIFKILLDRANQLVRREYLRPRIVTIQALVILCTHPTYSTNSYRNWILAGMAVRMAQDLGLHRTITTVEVSDKFKERRKKLWYNNKDDLVMFVNFIKLSGILGEILRRIYSPKAKSNGYKTQAMEHTVRSLQKMLEEWFINVPHEYKITEADLLEMRLNPLLYSGTKKINQGGPLTVCFHAVVLLLHRPFIVLEHDQNDSSSLSRSTELCTDAAKLAIDVARAIPYMTIAKFGWNFAAYSVFQAALIHVYNCTSKDLTVAKQAKDYLDISINECLAPLSEDVPAGPPLIPFLQNLFSLLKIEGTTFEQDKVNPSMQEQQQQQQYQQQQQQNHYHQEQQQHSQSSTIPTNDMLQTDNKTDAGSWLLNGGLGGNPALTQVAWQQLFSTAGTPFSNNDNMNRGFDAQGWDNFFMDNQAANNMFLP